VDECKSLNSGSLLETQFGEAIDKHEAVIRFNAAETEAGAYTRPPFSST